MNENYVQPALPGCRGRHSQGNVLLHSGGAGKVRVTLMGSGTDPAGVHRGAEMLSGVRHSVDIYSAPSFSGAAARRRWRSNAGTGCIRVRRRACLRDAGLVKATGPFIAATDYMRAWPDMIRQWVPGGSRRNRLVWRDARRCASTSIGTSPRQALAEEGAIRRNLTPRSPSSASTRNKMIRRKHEQCDASDMGNLSRSRSSTCWSSLVTHRHRHAAGTLETDKATMDAIHRQGGGGESARRQGRHGVHCACQRQGRRRTAAARFKLRPRPSDSSSLRARGRREA